uniref:Store-operated calcium entry-associated regulatory factor n=1 Tax=Bubo bubo TaxID=30461 RepID=A0A8C0IH89_BUBBB
VRAVMVAAGRAGAGPGLFLLFLCAVVGPAQCWDQPGRVLLREVQALTLYRGQYTAFRRTAAVPQLQCTGGTAGCSHVPEVVQCYNRGWDGYDVQWQCKADLEHIYRFGQIEVSCEGYDYPDDPYILRGSCSLLFRLELTEEGERKVKNSGSFGSSYYQSRKNSSDSGAGVIVLIVLLVLAFGVYKLFLSNQQPQQSFGDSDGFTRPSWQSEQAPPPGFKSSFTGRPHAGGNKLMPKKRFETLQKGLSAVGLPDPWFHSQNRNSACELSLEVQHLNLMWCLLSDVGNFISSDKAAARKRWSFSFPMKLMTFVT